MREDKYISKYLGESQPPEDIRKKIIDFLRDNPVPPDKAIHAMSNKLGIETDIFESHIYAMLGSFYGKGRYVDKGFTEDDFDPDEVKKGMVVEMEHTNDPDMAKRICFDHLSETPSKSKKSKYYTKLAILEKEIEEELSN